MVFVLERLRSLWRWAWSSTPVEVPRWWLHCPICDAELVGPWAAGAAWVPGPMRLTAQEVPPRREELVAKCPVHGHRPYNDPSQKPRYRRIAKPEG